ncbi:ribbon-helix-helix domain-containing protein [Rhodococcus sp. IEGM1300]
MIATELLAYPTLAVIKSSGYNFAPALLLRAKHCSCKHQGWQRSVNGMDYVSRSNEGRSGSLRDIRLDPFVSEFDMGLAQPTSRSVRLNGFATCLRLEQVYWNILGEMAKVNCCSVSALLSHVDREVHLRHGGVKNFSGLVRVVCVVHSQKESGCAVLG